MLAVGICFGATPAAAAGWFHGEWCVDDGSPVTVDADGAYMGDHIVCEWTKRAGDGPQLDAGLRCTGHYGENGEEKMDAGTMRLQGSAEKKDRLIITFSGAEPDRTYAYAPCKE